MATGIANNITDIFGTLHDTIGSLLGTTPVAAPPGSNPLTQVRVITAAQANDLITKVPGMTLPMLTSMGYAVVG